MHRRRSAWLVAVLVTVLVWMQGSAAATFSANGAGGAEVFLPLVVRSGQPAPPTDPGWLTLVNEFRAQAKLPAVVESDSWSEGSWLHARYMVKNDVIQHYEDPGNPWYTAEGNQAAQNCNLMVGSSVGMDDDYPILVWMQAPFHAVGLLDPALRAVGYGTYREAGGAFEMGAALDVLRGLGEIPESVQFPIAWPGEGAVVPLSYHWVETPSPLTSCPGYSAPAGLPIVLQLGSGGLTPDVTAHSLQENGIIIAHCIFDETNYHHPNPSLRDLGRSVLGARDAVVIIPREPLTPGAHYRVSVTANGGTTTWSFKVAESAPVPGSVPGDGAGTQGGEPAAAVRPIRFSARPD